MRDEIPPLELYLASFMSKDGAFHLVIFHAREEPEARNSIRDVWKDKGVRDLKVARVREPWRFHNVGIEIGYHIDLV